MKSAICNLLQTVQSICSPFLIELQCPYGNDIDSFTVILHSPNGRHLPAVRAVQRDCHWGPKNGGNSYWLCQPIMQWGTRQFQSIFRPTNPKSIMPAKWRPCLIPHWQPHCHQARTVSSLVMIRCQFGHLIILAVLYHFSPRSWLYWLKSY